MQLFRGLFVHLHSIVTVRHDYHHTKLSQFNLCMLIENKNNNNRFMKDIIFDNSQSLNINLIKNKFLKACSSMSAYMPEACISFIKMIQQCLNNIIFKIRIIVRACFAAWQRTIVLIGFDHSFCLQTCLQEKDMGKDYMQQYRYIVGHCCYNKYAQ